MKIYIRKIDAQCLTHQISVPKDIILTFFDNAKDKEKFIFVGKHSNFKGEVSILLSTDPRLGGDIKQVINAEGGMDVDDLLVIYKDKTYYTLEVLKNSNTEYRYFYELIDGSKDRHILLVSDDKTDNNIKTNIEDLIKEEYSKLDFSEMENEIEGLYKNFYISFSPEALMLIDDQDLPRYMFYSENYNNTNMCWNLEFNPKMRKYFGAIGGGSAYLYGLHYSQKHKTWMTGTNMNPIKLTYSEAINKAKDIRQKLCDAVEIVKKYKGTSNIDDYTKMYSELLESCGDIINKVWVKKYLHMMFPDMFITFYTWNWLSFLNKKCGFELHDNTFELSGELALLSRRVNLPCAIVGKVLFSLFGYYNNDNEENYSNNQENIYRFDENNGNNGENNNEYYYNPEKDGYGRTRAMEYVI